MSIYSVQINIKYGRKMSPKMVPATQFKAECLRLIDEMNRDRQPVVITKRGRPVAVLAPVASDRPKSIIGALRGTVLHYEDPFSPAVEPDAWNAQA